MQAGRGTEGPEEKEVDSEVSYTLNCSGKRSDLKTGYALSEVQKEAAEYLELMIQDHSAAVTRDH